MEKNISKRVVAGTLALLTVFGSAPATLQGVFAPTALVAQAVDASEAQGKIEYSRAQAYIESVKVDDFTYSGTAIKNNTFFGVAEGKLVTITSKVPLDFYSGEYLDYQRKAGYVNNKITYLQVNVRNDDFVDTNFNLSGSYTKDEVAAFAAAANNYSNDLVGYVNPTIYKIVRRSNNTFISYFAASPSYNLNENETEVGRYVFAHNVTNINGTIDYEIADGACQGVAHMSISDYNTKSAALAKYNYFSNTGATKLSQDYVTADTVSMAQVADAAVDTLDTTNAGKVIATKSGDKFVYTYKSTANGVSADFVKKSITEVKTATGNEGTFAYTDANTNAALNKEALVYGTTVKASCDKPFDITATGVTTVSSVWDDTTGKFVATFEVADKDYTATTRVLEKNFTYTASTNTVLATSKNSPKDVVNGVAAKISASYYESITGKQYKLLTADEKKLYVTTPGGATEVLDTVEDTTLVYKKAATAIDNNGSVPFGSAGVSATVTVNKDFLGKSADDYLYSVSVKKPGDDVAKGVTVNSAGNEVGGDTLNVTAGATGFTINGIESAGTYEATIIVWPTDTTAAAMTASYKFTIGTNDSLSEANVKLTGVFEEYTPAAGVTKVTNAVNNKKTTDTFAIGSATDVAEFQAVKDINGNYVLVDVTGTLVDATGANLAKPAVATTADTAGKYYITGETVAREPGTVHTLYVNITDSDFGGSVAEPLVIPVQWKLVDPAIPDGIAWTDAAGLTIVYDITAKTEDAIKKEITDKLDLQGSYKLSDVTFAWSTTPPEGTAGDDDFDDGEAGAGIPTTEGTYYVTATIGTTSVTKKFKLTPEKVAKAQLYLYPAAPVELTYGDEITDDTVDEWVLAVKSTVKVNNVDTEVYTPVEDVDFSDLVVPENWAPTLQVKGIQNAGDVAETVTNMTTAGQNPVANVKIPDAMQTKYLAEVESANFTIKVNKKELKKADFDAITVSLTNGIANVKAALADKDGEAAGIQNAKDKDVITGENAGKPVYAELGLKVVSGYIIANEEGTYDVELVSTNDNYTGTFKTKWKVTAQAADFAVTTAEPYLVAADVVRVDVTKASAAAAKYAKVDLGVISGEFDDADEATAKLLYTDGTTGKEITTQNGAYSMDISITDATKKFYVRAYGKDEYGNIVYGAVKEVDVIAMLEAKVGIERNASGVVTNYGTSLVADKPVFVDDEGVLKNYIYVKKGEYKTTKEVNGKNVDYPIVPVKFGFVADNNGVVATKDDLEYNKTGLISAGKANVVKGNYTENEYGATVKVLDSTKGLKMVPYIDFGNGAVIYGEAVEYYSFNDIVAHKIGLVNINSTKTVKGVKKAAMRVARANNYDAFEVPQVKKTVNTYVEMATEIANGEKPDNTVDAKYTKTTLKIKTPGTTPVYEANEYKTVVIKEDNLTAFGLVFDRAATVDLGTASDTAPVKAQKLAAAKAALVVGASGFTTGSSKTPKVSTIDDATVLGNYDDNTATIVNYGGTVLPTSADASVVVRGYATIAGFNVYTVPVKYTLTAEDTVAAADVYNWNGKLNLNA